MKCFIAVMIIAIVLIAGCTQNVITSSSQTPEYLEDSDFVILNSTWAFEDNCQQGNESVGYVFVNCYKKNLECEVYVNNVKSNYGLDALQDCDDHEIAVAEIELNEKPDFISVQSENKYYYTRRDKPKIIEICCSYVNDSSHKLIRDYEICKITRLKAQCPEQSVAAPSSKGFEQINVSSWDLNSDGTLNLKVKNGAGQDVVIRTIYINNAITIPANLPMLVSIGNESQNITVIGERTESIENSYSIRLAIEYSLASSPQVYFNSTGTISGTYS